MVAVYIVPRAWEEVPTLQVALGLRGAREVAQSGERLYVCCPFHPDRRPSLFLDRDDHWHCFGCGAHGRTSAEMIQFALRSGRWSMDDLARIVAQPISPSVVPRSGGPRKGLSQQALTARYCYFWPAPEGPVPYIEVHRYDGPEGKTYRQGHHQYPPHGPCHFCASLPQEVRAAQPHPQSIHWRVGGLPTIPYGWEIFPHDCARPILFVEGEKVASTLVAMGYPATCIHGGCTAQLSPQALRMLAGRSYIVIPDNDRPGRAFAQRIAEQMTRAGIAARIYDPYPRYGITAQGADLADLEPTMVDTILADERGPALCL